MSKENKRLVREITEVVWNSRGLERIPELFAPDFVGDYRPYALREEHEGVRAMVEGAWTAFPDYHEELHELRRLSRRRPSHHLGTPRGQWGPLPATGKRAEFDEIVVLQIRGGKVVGHRGVVNAVTAKALGLAIPPTVTERPRHAPTVSQRT